jgi:hypothetical protein
VPKIKTSMNVHRLGEELFSVVSERDAKKSYNVSLDQRAVAVCDCPHYIYRCKQNNILCKHGIQVMNFIEQNNIKVVA